jgi:agmatine/peptidylarginine deiminase
VILTEKIVQENQFCYEKPKLIKLLENLFEVEHVVLIPWWKKEFLGHADGMLRFIDDETVLVNSIEKSANLEGRLKEHGLKFEYLRYNVEKENENYWAYINFFQTKDLILLPKFNADEDEQALEQMRIYYPNYARNNRIAQVDMTEIVKEGGALNCISWTIKSDY